MDLRIRGQELVVIPDEPRAEGRDKNQHHQDDEGKCQEDVLRLCSCADFTGARGTVRVRAAGRLIVLRAIGNK